MLTIGKLATLAEISADALRFYEDEGLISPADRSASGYRLYDQDSVKRIRFIKQAQHCGFTLAEIRDLLTLRGSDRACCDDVRNQAIEKKLQLEQKIKAMKSMSKALDQLIADCTRKGRPVAECTILAAFEQTTKTAH
ncbi:MAG: heavy metal-responsive transcriptional regulator [Reyranella sp.]|uniref:heavy metal-responsive transcriptional regulator n=1 Tax=Reyranella sp. TaxID=1929291 RepID=UPI001AC5DA42|nr:heavy metal-responsive transcriptional regulator [Reyranella sp.]MBN9086712.1 heavy metal-responsive transcriptional regulator [Reyranella sp.]